MIISDRLADHYRTREQQMETLSRIYIGDGPFRVYHVDQDTLDRFGTLEDSDLNQPYIVVCGCIQFISDEGDQR